MAVRRALRPAHQRASVVTVTQCTLGHGNQARREQRPTSAGGTRASAALCQRRAYRHHGQYHGQPVKDNADPGRHRVVHHHMGHRIQPGCARDAVVR